MPTLNQVIKLTVRSRRVWHPHPPSGQNGEHIPPGLKLSCQKDGSELQAKLPVCRTYGGTIPRDIRSHGGTIFQHTIRMPKTIQSSMKKDKTG